LHIAKTFLKLKNYKQHGIEEPRTTSKDVWSPEAGTGQRVAPTPRLLDGGGEISSCILHLAL